MKYNENRIDDNRLEQVTGGCFYCDDSSGHSESTWSNNYSTIYRPDLLGMTQNFNANDKAIIDWFVGELDAISGNTLTIKNKFYDSVNKFWQMNFSEEACFTEIRCLFNLIEDNEFAGKC